MRLEQYRRQGCHDSAMVPPLAWLDALLMILLGAIVRKTGAITQKLLATALDWISRKTIYKIAVYTRIIGFASGCNILYIGLHVVTLIWARPIVDKHSLRRWVMHMHFHQLISIYSLNSIN